MDQRSPINDLLRCDTIVIIYPWGRAPYALTNKRRLFGRRYRAEARNSSNRGQGRVHQATEEKVRSGARWRPTESYAPAGRIAGAIPRQGSGEIDVGSGPGRIRGPAGPGRR